MRFRKCCKSRPLSCRHSVDAGFITVARLCPLRQSDPLSGSETEEVWLMTISHRMPVPVRAKMQ